MRVENLSFPLTISAPQAALFHCLSEGAEPRRLYLERPEGAEAGYWREEYGLELRSLEEAGEAGKAHLPLLEERDDIPALLADLLGQARTAHSGFPVSAVLETDLGLVSGVNIECSDWSRGLCAERVALAKAVAAGANAFRRLHIHTGEGEFSSPCGACRQVLAEHMPGATLCLHHADRSRSDFFACDLLPYGFHSSALRNSSS
ncbi:MAG: cytidine deaminase [Balneolaceae bacterium]|nr:cytidine deaminase [Balneolaceae bacterium]